MSAEPIIHGRSRKAALAAGAAGVLVLGVVAAPPRPMRPASEERIAPILEEEIEQRDPVRLLRGARETGLQAAAHVVEVRPARATGAPQVAPDVSAGQVPPPTGGFGLLVGDGNVLTHLDALDGDLAPLVTTSAGDRLGRVVAADAATGLALVALDGAGGRLAGDPGDGRAPITAVAPSAGTPGIGAARSRGVDLVAPLIVAAVAGDRLTLSAASGITRPGTPVFTTAGEALAIAAGPRNPSAAFLIAPALGRMRGLAMGTGASTLGVTLQAPSPSLARALGEGGVPIADVGVGSPAASAGIRAGDVLVDVGGAQVAGVDDARAAIARLAAGADAVLQVRRAGVTRPFVVRPHLWRPSRLAEGDRGSVPAAQVLPASALAALSLPVAARVVPIDVEPLPRPGAGPRGPRRLPAVVQVHAGDARYLVVVEPGR